MILRLSQRLRAVGLGAREPGSHRLDALGETHQPMRRAEPEPVAWILAGDDCHVEREPIERARQPLQDAAGQDQETRKHRGACPRDRAGGGLAENDRQRNDGGARDDRKAGEQSSQDSSHASRASHAQLPSMRRIRSTRSRVENGFVTYSSAPSDSPFSR